MNARPHIVVLCGSLAWPEDLMLAAMAEWRQGHQVYGPTSQPHIASTEHDRRHRAQIDLATEVVVVARPDGSLGDATQSEMEYALNTGKPVRFWPPEADLKYLVNRIKAVVHHTLDAQERGA
ncbi:hypothetical protein [Kutzneria albida]|uniref:DUF4062 domain-containing protein n=1 Tax=Kutzneria albida DSM 43870 TaxID=1449976 RepID=W5WJ79_9PSEU|nr:hypothetical protein [Kutzneria albida]AHH98219.1 hypothetical protein KALB_4857 [Kutzneria albida DSM 43870]